MRIKRFILPIILILNLTLPALSVESNEPETSKSIEVKNSNIPKFNDPLCLLVGLNNSELSYREVNGLAGFEFLSVPYRSDVMDLISELNPSQIIIKHPSGFVGLYSPDGQLVRGIQTVNGPELSYHGTTPPSILTPTETTSNYDSIYYPGTNTGGVSQGGLGYRPPPKGRNLRRHFLKLGSLIGITTFQYPGYFNAYSTYDKEKLLPSLLIPQIPAAIGTASAYADARLDQSEYNQARPQPRDYMFQPVVEGY